MSSQEKQETPAAPSAPTTNSDSTPQAWAGPEEPEPRQPARYIVGIGASAGGLEALESFFQRMPPDGEIAFVVVQHLSPDFRSMMDELLARHTKMAVHRVEDGMWVEPNALYLIPPKKEMIISQGRLLLTDKDPAKGLALPIDTFFRSLAQDAGERAVAVVLSGTGSDGSRGICDVHEAGGLVIAQSVDSAAFDGMPRSAVDTGVVDLVLPPSAMPAAITNYIEHACREPREPSDDGDSGVSSILKLLRSEYDIDFLHYKPTTIRRRIERRLLINHVVDLAEYRAMLSQDRVELRSLYKDLLIGVTKFFRDAEAFENLKREFLPDLFSGRDENEELRIWAAGCATGEEAYSIAILVDEYLRENKLQTPVKIFATDLHRASLETASAGCYPAASVSELDEDRLQRYFTQTDGGYVVDADLRRMIVFAPHNVIRDAPFTKIDLITCRNLLIYFNAATQKKALSLFHFGLRHGGVLFLGPSESPGELSDGFTTLDPHWKIYRKSDDVSLPADIRLPVSPESRGLRAPTSPVKPSQAVRIDRPHTAAQEMLIRHHAPPSLLVTENFQLLHAYAGANRFLRVPEGHSSLNVLEMVPQELKLALSGALRQARLAREAVTYTGVESSTSEGERELRLTVLPVPTTDGAEKHFLVTLDERAARPVAAESDDESLDIKHRSGQQIEALEEELKFTRENLQATLEEMETANEELQAANEELVASNEELQSTNEELHSVNEELYTVNAEYQRKIGELTELNADIDNLLAAGDVGTIFLDRELKIRKFTPQIASTFHLLPSDVGRPIEGFAHSLDLPELIDELEGVIDRNERLEREILDRAGAPYLLRILPYRARTGEVEGVVLSLIDISLLKRTETDLRRMSKVFEDAADPIIIEDLTGKIVHLNDEAVEAYGYQRQELLGRHASILSPEDQHAHSTTLRRRCREKEKVRNVEVSRRNKSGEVRPVLLTLSLLMNEQGQPDAIATIAKDIKRRKQAEDAVRLAVERRDSFLAMLSHELRNPLSAVLNSIRALRMQKSSPRDLEVAFDIADRQAGQMARLLDDLLDVSRITQDKIELRKEVIDLREVAREAVDANRSIFEGRRQQLSVSPPDKPLPVYGDSARLQQIVGNLLNNASKYTPTEGRIGLHIERTGRRARIVVRDDGEGIPAERLDDIFEPFMQADKTLDRSDGGMGVGLTLVRSLVALHGGEVSAHSEGVGRGSEFVVSLPITRRSKSDAVDASRRTPSLAGLHVLLVEDSAAIRVTLRMLLEADGFVVSEAADGLEGLDVLLRDHPDVGLIDIGLPGMNGYELAKAVRSSTNGAVRLVALTGYGREEDRRAVRAAGFDAHLVKPLKMERLYQTLADLGLSAQERSAPRPNDRKPTSE
ncbi:MAG: chemotaxis protein CheB [Pirellulaceae bacterium]